MMKKTPWFCALVLAALPLCVAAQDSAQVSKQTYAHAERFMGYNTRPLVDHAVTHVKWQDDTHFWYVDHDASGDHYMIMNVTTGKASQAFDAKKMAAALDTISKKKVHPDTLRLDNFKPVMGGHLQVTWHGRHYTCDLAGKPGCRRGRARAPTPAKKDFKARNPGVVSPDGTKVAFIRDWNLWVRNIRTGEEHALTTDGIKNDGYATDNAGWTHSRQAVLVWSPNSRYIATFQQDQRKVGDMATVGATAGHPQINVWKYPLPGDKHVIRISRVIIDVPSEKVVRLHMKPDFHRSSLCDDISCSGHGHWDDVKWGPHSRTLAFVSTSRDHKQETFRVADPATGDVRTVFHVSVPHYYESGIGKVNWQYLPDSNAIVWYSWRNNWGNLYLYNLKTGKREHAITRGEGNVTEVLHVDRKTHTLWFRGVGRQPGWNPYYQAFYKVNLNGDKPTLLTPQKADHGITMSPDGKYFVDSWSTPSKPPVTVLRRASNGRKIAMVAKADISRLKKIGWVPPTQFKVKARDGKTTLYGMMFKPTDFNPHKTYPVIDYIYPGPQTGSIFTFGFASARGDHQAMAELGFIVVAIDGLGTPDRSKSFHDTWYGDMGDNTLPDQIAAIKQLARRHPWIDLDHVGIWGHSGGGFATADAMFTHPDFFKVGWAESGNHDNRDYEADWGEKWQGLLKTQKDGSTNYDNQANQDKAKNLQGHLMLTYGTLDDNVPPESTQIVVQALIKANKDFDMIAIPNVHHGYGYATPYITRRRWDYFVKHLAGKTPPKHYKLKSWPWR